jgi:hypothetical protein
MLRKMLFAAAGATLLATPALAGPWVNYDGYQPIERYAYAYSIPYGYPFVPYTDVIVAAPVITYAPVHVRVYAVPQEPPYYNVPPYPVYAPY